MGSTDGIRLIDADPDNDESNDGGADEDGKAWIIDGVCWNTGSGTDNDCDGAADPMIAAGVWAEDTYVNVCCDRLSLVTNGNNDDGVSDWEAIPEFSTLLMPIASVILIVGYNYRRKTKLAEI